MSFRILIVDDDNDVVDTMKTVLIARKFAVDSASDSQEALEKIKTFDPQMILLDVMMRTPSDGFSLSYTLRSGRGEYERWSKIPIVMISGINKELKMNYSSATDSEIIAANEFVDKPITAEKLIELAEKYMNAAKNK
ncbi:MAG TPA: response regulator [Candidatus Wallbacteria bacterium]|nr:MAG: Transcriptional regulatory protein YycF [bacterium ADurb.Bin243]HPG56471.1 response regulator [Candidatus Wallbacteria bacterium]